MRPLQTAPAIGAAINRIAKIGLEPLLRDAGFARQARVFRRPRGEGIDVVSVQGSKWNRGSEGKFTVNLGVYFPAIAALSISPSDATEEPGDGNCPVRRRLPLMKPVPDEQWWSIDARTDLDRMAKDVRLMLTTYGLPWFETVPSLSSAIPLLVAEESFYYAAVAALATGDRDAARQHLETLIGRFPQRQEYRDWGGRHALLTG